MGTEYRFEGVIWMPDGYGVPDEDFMDLSAFCYGDKHAEYAISVVPGTIEEVKEDD